jgi:hypothetical protein
LRLIEERAVSDCTLKPLFCQAEYAPADRWHHDHRGQSIVRKFLTDLAKSKRRAALADYFRVADDHERLKALWRSTTWGLIRDFIAPVDRVPLKETANV